jgi:hypothetical protein
VAVETVRDIGDCVTVEIVVGSGECAWQWRMCVSVETVRCSGDCVWEWRLCGD